jgi:hypothetical protein
MMRKLFIALMLAAMPACAVAQSINVCDRDTPGNCVNVSAGGVLDTGVDLSDVLGTSSLVLATGADGIANTTDTVLVAAFNYCWNGTTWDRCFSYNPCDRAARTQLPINQSASAEIVAASAGKKIYVCSGMLATDADETVQFVEGTGTVCATSQGALSGVISLPADGNGFLINYLQTNTAAEALCILQGGTEDIDGWITYVQE